MNFQLINLNLLIVHNRIKKQIMVNINIYVLFIVSQPFGLHLTFLI